MRDDTVTLCNHWYEIEQDNQGKQKLHVKSRKNARKAKSGVVGETGRRHGELTERLNSGLTCRASICLYKTLIRFVSVLWPHINKAHLFLFAVFARRCNFYCWKKCTRVGRGGGGSEWASKLLS